MDPYERIQLCDGIKEESFKAGEYVIRQGDKGDKFYMIADGDLYATKAMKEGEEPQEVYSYKAGDYFGELALLKDIPRQANVISRTDVRLL
jgi:cAMP-dependent protein kinase regulator